MNYNQTLAENYFKIESELKDYLVQIAKEILLEKVFPRYKTDLTSKAYTLYAINDSYRSVLFYVDFGQGFPTDKDVEIGRYLAQCFIEVVGEKTFEFFKANYCSLHYRRKIFSGVFE